MIWKVARGSRRLLYSCSWANEAANDGETSPMRVRRECEDAPFGASRGDGSNLAFEDLLRKKPPTCAVIWNCSPSLVVTIRYSRCPFWRRCTGGGFQDESWIAFTVLGAGSCSAGSKDETGGTTSKLYSSTAARS